MGSSFEQSLIFKRKSENCLQTDGPTEVNQAESTLTKKQRDIYIYIGICTLSPAHIQADKAWGNMRLLLAKLNFMTHLAQ